MAVSSGFYNSLNRNRRYNAEQMSAIFDGIINDGVFMSVGNAFMVTPGTGLSILVDIGRAWFNSKWLYNDALLPLELNQPEVLLDRIDAVVIEIDSSIAVNNGLIKVVKGVPSTTPQNPAMLHTEQVHQYALAYIYRKSQSTVITQSNITYNVGTSSCPFVTGILQVMNIDNIVAQWQAQWVELTHKHDVDFHDWFDSLLEYVNENAAAKLANQIYRMEQVTEVTLLAEKWMPDGFGRFTQVVEVFGSTADSSALLVSVISNNSNQSEWLAYTKAFSIISTGYAELLDNLAIFTVWKRPTSDIVIGLRGLGAPIVLTDSDFMYVYDSSGNMIDIDPVGFTMDTASITEPEEEK